MELGCVTDSERGGTKRDNSLDRCRAHYLFRYLVDVQRFTYDLRFRCFGLHVGSIRTREAQPMLAPTSRKPICPHAHEYEHRGKNDNHDNKTGLLSVACGNYEYNFKLRGR